MRAESPSPEAFSRDACKGGSPLDTATVPHLSSGASSSWGVPSTRLQQQRAKKNMKNKEEHAAVCFCGLPVYLFLLCRKNQRLLYGSLPTSFQEEPALLRQLPEGGLEAEKDEVTR